MLAGFLFFETGDPNGHSRETNPVIVGEKIIF